MADVAELVGKTLASVEVSNVEVTFVTEDGITYKMYHEQDCCEDVAIEDVVGDWQDLVGSPITMAEEVNFDDPGPQSDYDESYTWTFYKFATVKGYVDVRWYGTSNGYYSEGVNFRNMNDPKDYGW